MIGRQHDMDMVSAARRGLSRRAEADSPTDAIAAIVAGCENCLREAGIIGALRFLNGRTRYRYTGLYRAEPPLLRNVQLFDRENPTLNVSGEVKPLQQTYCGIVQETNDTVRIANALDWEVVRHADFLALGNNLAARFRFVNAQFRDSIEVRAADRELRRFAGFDAEWHRND